MLYETTWTSTNKTVTSLELGHSYPANGTVDVPIDINMVFAFSSDVNNVTLAVDLKGAARSCKPPIESRHHLV